MSAGIKLWRDRPKFSDEVLGRDDTCVGQAYQRNTPSRILHSDGKKFQKNLWNSLGFPSSLQFLLSNAENSNARVVTRLC